MAVVVCRRLSIRRRQETGIYWRIFPPTESELLNQPSFDELQAGWEIAFNNVRSGKIRCAETAAGLFPFAR